MAVQDIIRDCVQQHPDPLIPGFVVADQIVPDAIELSSLKELVGEARKK